MPRYGRRGCSHQSVLTAVDRFVRAVDDMDAAVLLPSRLRDMDVVSRRGKGPPPPPGLHDLYSCYGMLKDVRSELLWGPQSSVDLYPSSTSTPTPTPTSLARRSGATPSFLSGGTTTPRQASDDGLGSSIGGEQDLDSDFESVTTETCATSALEQTSHLATAFRHHLHGLHAILHQLADSADYLCSRYVEEVESPIA